MMKKVVVILLSLFFAACSNSSNNQPVKTENQSYQNNKRDTINALGEAVVGELQKYTKKYGTIKNPWKEPTKLFIIFSIEKSDTLVSIFSHWFSKIY
ncbi:hypothetical protein GCM10011506_38100 [Marivirga lumbricoides]|uniref:Lipoprotein n=1 Tax=Marivirga lumbricoides TaxID=1046115 RepID=A0ABQ1N1E2_9BACT|nr:hypothetical protein GCM10011506_38100 [Marivirga lumbricoides]